MDGEGVVRMSVCKSGTHRGQKKGLSNGMRHLSQIRHRRLATLAVTVEVREKRCDVVIFVDITRGYIEEAPSWAALAKQELATQLPQTVDVLTRKYLKLRVRARRLIVHVLNRLSGAEVPAEILSHGY